MAKMNVLRSIVINKKPADIFPLIKQIELEESLGKPVGARFFGGALCLSTNGVHFLDLACGDVEQNGYCIALLQGFLSIHY